MTKLSAKCVLQSSPQTTVGSLALLIVRLITGIAFVLHGSGKIQAPMSWLGPDSHVPALFQFLATLSEFGGGMALVLGLFTRVATFGIFCTMSFAVYMHAFIRHDPFVNLQGGVSFEPALGYLGVALLIMAMGPGKFSLDRLIFGQRDI